MKTIGIRKENKGPFERRSPVVPSDVEKLVGAGFKVLVEKSEERIIPSEQFSASGAVIVDQFDKKDVDVVLGIKEVKTQYLLQGKVYLFFSHVIKGQHYNMDMLREILKKRITLIDYETIKDDKGRRLIFFGRYAGLAGAIDTLWTFGKRLSSEGIKTPFERVRRAFEYKDLSEAMKEISEIGHEIKQKGLPQTLCPLTVSFIGYGNVSSGAQEIFDLLPFEDIKPEDLLKIEDQKYQKNLLYRAVFKEKDLYARKDGKQDFDLDQYYKNPELYDCIFGKYTPFISILVNGNYWDERYPRVFTYEDAKRVWNSEKRKMKVIGDISCDVEGGIQVTVKATAPEKPVFVYNPRDGSVVDGLEGEGIAVLAVDILPSELPLESSQHFSHTLMRFIPDITLEEYDKPFESLKLSPEIKNAIVAHGGRLTPNYEYLKKYL